MTEPVKYRKKPVVIEAHKWNDPHGWPTSWIPVPFRLGEDEHGAYLIIPTLEGELKARDDDWIIRGVAGEFYPCKPEIFEATYEPVQEGSDD